jgi:hypothetical protein
MIKFEALNAKYGDALLLHYKTGTKKRLWIIDGGPAGVWPSMRKRLESLCGNGKKLTVDLAMLSHVDDDHVHGMIDMMKALTKKTPKAPTFIDIRRFWHNSFVDLVGSQASLSHGMASLAAVQGTAQAALAANRSSVTIDTRLACRREFAVLASINQGRELRDYIETLHLSGNEPFGDTLSSQSGKMKIDEARVTIVGPIASRLDDFRKKWAAAAGKPAALASLFREDLDESPTNLSSLVMLVEIGKRKILLTGDARGDDIVEGFKDAKLGGKLPMKLDVLKMPHHGSDRNMTEKFLQSFPANHYVISADGKYGNPDCDAVKAIVQVRGNERYKIHFTNKVPKISNLMEKLSRGKKFTYEFRNAAAPSIVIDL